MDDLADAVILLMEKYDYLDIGEFINIGTGVDISIKDLAILIKEIIGYSGELKYDSTKPDGTPKKLLDISKLKKIGFYPKIILKDGISDIYKWYKSQE